MHPSDRHVLRLVLLVPVLLFFPFSRASSQSLQLTDLGVLAGDEESRAWGMNARGQIVGWSRSGSRLTAFVHTPGAGMTAIGALPGNTSSAARAIDDAGIVVGSSWAAPISQPGHAFRWHPVLGLQDLGTLGGATSEAMGIGSGGVIVGTSASGGPQTEAFALAPAGSMVSLTPGGLGEAHCVAADGRIGGASNGLPRFWSPALVGSMPPTLPGFPRGSVQAFAASGSATGVLTDPSGTVAHLATWSGGAVTDLGLVGRYSTAGGISSDGTVVGTYQTSFSVTPYGFVATVGGGIVDVNTLVVNLGSWQVTSIYAINDLGQMAANARDNLGRRRAVRLDPVLPGLSGAVTRSGEGCAGAALVPELWSSAPSLAAGVVLGVRDAGALVPGFLAASFGPAQTTAMGGGCLLHVDPVAWFDVVHFQTDASGRWELPMGLGGAPGLLGVEVSIQAFTLDPPTPFGVALSNGLRLFVGS